MLIEEIHSESFNTYTTNSFEQEMQQRTNPPHVSIDSMSVRKSSGVNASSFGYDSSQGKGGDNREDGDNNGGNVGKQDQSQCPLSQFTNEVDFKYCTKNEDHGFRQASLGFGVVKKPHKGRGQQRMITFDEDSSTSFDSMSIGTQHSNSSNESHVYLPYVMNYDQPPFFNYGMSFKFN